jgi:hypothetical protein
MHIRFDHKLQAALFDLFRSEADCGIDAWKFVILNNTFPRTVCNDYDIFLEVTLMQKIKSRKWAFANRKIDCVYASMLNTNTLFNQMFQQGCDAFGENTHSTIYERTLNVLWRELSGSLGTLVAVEDRVREAVMGQL